LACAEAALNRKSFGGVAGEEVVGFGDELVGSGLARGAKERGKRIAFGDKNEKQIIWSNNAAIIFENNPNVAKPGSEWDRDLEWIKFHSGARIYQQHDPEHDRWIWNYQFKARPGEIFFSKVELSAAQSAPGDFILIEPNVLSWKPSAVNKQWHGYQQVADALGAAGYQVVQFVYGERHKLRGVKLIPTPTMRQALALMTRAKLFIGPEGGGHHAAAAFGLPAVVLFGGFAPPQVLGYDMHVNLTGGATACGSRRKCSHCEKAMQQISVDQVVEAALR
jgi:hypothetical protein